MDTTDRINKTVGQIARDAFYGVTDTIKVEVFDSSYAWEAAGKAVINTLSTKELLTALLNTLADNKMRQPQLGREWAVLLTEAEKLMAWYEYKVAPYLPGA